MGVFSSPQNHQLSASSGNILCKHKHAAIAKVSGTSKNPGRRFFRCPYWKDETMDCGFFKWSDEVLVCLTKDPCCDSSASNVQFKSWNHSTTSDVTDGGADMDSLRQMVVEYQGRLNFVEQKSSRRKSKILLLKSELMNNIDKTKELEVQLRDLLLARCELEQRFRSCTFGLIAIVAIACIWAQLL